MTRLDFDLSHFQARVLQDALAEATAGYWRRRAAQFEAAKSRPGDYLGHATASEIAEREAQLDAFAKACRSRAVLALDDEALIDAVDHVLRDYVTADRQLRR